MRYALIALAVLCSSCIATTADLDRIHTRTVESEARIKAQVDAVREAIDEKCADVEAAKAALDTVQSEVEQTSAETERLAAQAKERAWSTADRVLGLALTVAGLGGAGWAAKRGAVKQVNIERDRRRVKRGEPV